MALLAKASWRRLAAAASIALAGLARAGERPAAGSRVLALYQSEPGLPAFAAFDSGLRSALQVEDDVTLFTEHMERVRLPDPGYGNALRDWLRIKYARARPDVVVAVGDDAIAFLADPETVPWPDVPVVFGFTDPRLSGARGLPPTFTGVTEHFAVRETLELALGLLPGTRHVALVGGASRPDRPFSELLRREVAALAGRADAIDLIGLPMPELEQRLRALPDATVVIGISFFQDGAGRFWTGPAAARVLSAAARGPLFTVHAHLLGTGIAGGVLTDFERSGRRVARVALRVLAGEAPATIPLESSDPGRALLDGRELDRWRVPDARVPRDAEVRFREPPPWSKHRPALVALGLLLLVQSALIVGLLVERRGRRRAEAHARENLAVVAHMNRVGAIGELAGAFAHELNSPLGAMLNNAQAARRLLGRGPEASAEVAACLQDLVDDAQRAGEVIRRIRGVLRREDARPVPLDVSAAIRDAVRLLASDARDREVAVALDVPADLPRVTGDGVQIVQVILNLVLNAIDALAGTSREQRWVHVSAAARRGGVEIRVADSGPGIPPAQLDRVFDPFFTTKATGLGMGLAISRSIVEAHGGSIAVETAPGGGAAFTVFLPAARRPHEAGAAA